MFIVLVGFFLQPTANNRLLLIAVLWVSMEPWRVKRLLTLACRTLEQKASQQSCAEMTECGHLPISIVDVCMNIIYRCPPISILVKLGFYKMLYENINTVVALFSQLWTTSTDQASYHIQGRHFWRHDAYLHMSGQNRHGRINLDHLWNKRAVVKDEPVLST